MKCENLDMWKRACRLSVELYRFFETSKAYGFKEQITRSGLSVASNIAEGLEKDSLAENVRYLEIARGSVAELITQLYIGIEAGFIDKHQGMLWVREANDILRMLKGYKNYVHTKGSHHA